jgi:hypothetical protein
MSDPSAARKRSNADIDAELQIASEPYKQLLLQAGGGGIDLPSVVAVHKVNLQRLPRAEHAKVFRDLALSYWLLEKKGMARTYARKYREPDATSAEQAADGSPDD